MTRVVKVLPGQGATVQLGPKVFGSLKLLKLWALQCCAGAYVFKPPHLLRVANVIAVASEPALNLSLLTL